MGSFAGFLFLFLLFFSSFLFPLAFLTSTRIYPTSIIPSVFAYVALVGDFSFEDERDGRMEMHWDF